MSLKMLWLCLPPFARFECASASPFRAANPEEAGTFASPLGAGISRSFELYSQSEFSFKSQGVSEDECRPPLGRRRLILLRGCSATSRRQLRDAHLEAYTAYITSQLCCYNHTSSWMLEAQTCCHQAHQRDRRFRRSSRERASASAHEPEPGSNPANSSVYFVFSAEMSFHLGQESWRRASLAKPGDCSISGHHPNLAPIGASQRTRAPPSSASLCSLA